MELLLREEIKNFIGKQVSRDMFSINPAAESKSERKVFMMTHQSSVLQNNASMVANNVVTLANALLNRHGIYVELEFAVSKLANFSKKEHLHLENKVLFPSALRFSSI
ncbi:MAG: hypothetical protein SGILL_009643 [Bacillariaceae sp.]